MVDGRLLIEKLLIYAKQFLWLNNRDEIYFRNLLLREFKLDSPLSMGDFENDLSYIKDLDVPDILTNEIQQYATENNLVINGEEELFSAYIFGLLTPVPSVVEQKFKDIKKTYGIESACDYFYNLCVKNNYIQKTAISKNLKWEYFDGDRLLEITINLSKPEKDNKDIAKLLSKPQNVSYPKCALCKENEGFKGSLTKPPRENIRTITLNLGGEDWFVQYSPYAYYEEHLIAISNNHTPMHIERDTIEKLLDFVDYFPNYAIGSNACLPIVGGSILNHEHFQGGLHLMPMHKAPLKKQYRAVGFDNVQVGIVNWYNSVIRLESKDRNSLLSLATKIIDNWKVFTYTPCQIVASTGETLHNSVSPVMRKIDETYRLDLILRNNRTNDQYPDGIFHAHKQYHNIKKEGIGLIEAMGLFILPGRLKRQLHSIAEILCGNTAYDMEAINTKENDLYVHKDMIAQLMENGVVDSLQKAEEIVRAKVNQTCKNILYNTAVFKDTPEGNLGFNIFLNLNDIYC